jgi:hypothetical protein
MIDFSPLLRREVQAIDFARQLSLDDLRAITNQSIDTMLAIINDLSDAEVTFIPYDPDAHDPHAPEGEQHAGWNLAHIIAHVTSGSEEGAALSSLLARGFPTAERPRYETPWQAITTRAQCVQRLEESRRMRLAYLDTWPDQPHLDVYRDVSPRYTARVGLVNAPAAFIHGVAHEVGHFDQMREVARQAIAARQGTR